MKSLLCISMLMVICVVPAGFAQHEEIDNNRQQMEMQAYSIELQMQELRLERQKAELDIMRDEAAMHRQMKMIEMEAQKAVLNQDSSNPHKAAGHIFMILCAVVNILAAVWVFQDIQNRKAGSGLWIVITLLAGLLGALVYAITRLTEEPQAKSK